MSCVQVLAPGFLTTVQDLGRPGYAHLGVSASGAADPLSLRLANLLVGNPEGAAALEMTITGATLRFPEGATLALGGSNFGARLNRAPLAPWTTATAAPDSVLEIGQSQTGARCYLALRGGIRVPSFLGSASTHLLSGLGGVAGRPLQSGDLLRVGREPRHAPKHGLRPAALAALAPRTTLRVTPGPQAQPLGEPVLAQFLASEYSVTEQANRMGLRLLGPELPSHKQGAGFLSQGVTCGSIQITNSGQPLILFVEQQTTGGYPVIACVISVDLPSVGQLRPGSAVRFAAITTAEALRLLRRQEQWIASEEWAA